MKRGLTPQYTCVQNAAATESRSRAVSTASAFLLPSPDDSPLSSDKEDQIDDGSAYLEEKQTAPTRQRSDDDSAVHTNPYELYLDTPDVLLPISHPGHNFSIYGKVPMVGPTSSDGAHTGTCDT